MTDYIKLHNKIISLLLEYSNLMIEQGVESESYTLSNNTKITIKNSKKSFKKKDKCEMLDSTKCYATYEDEGIFFECLIKDRDHLKKGLRHRNGKVVW